MCRTHPPGQVGDLTAYRKCTSAAGWVGTLAGYRRWIYAPGQVGSFAGCSGGHLQQSGLDPQKAFPFHLDLGAKGSFWKRGCAGDIGTLTLSFSSTLLQMGTLISTVLLHSPLKYPLKHWKELDFQGLRKRALIFSLLALYTRLASVISVKHWYKILRMKD